MPVPTGAVYEARPAGGMAVWNVAHLLERDERRPYTSRDPEGIQRIYVHHSGADGPSGFRGAQGTARYSVRNKGWP